MVKNLPLNGTSAASLRSQVQRSCTGLLFPRIPMSVLNYAKRAWLGRRFTSAVGHSLMRLRALFPTGWSNQMTELEKVAATLEIHALKARYFRMMDCKDWAGLEAVFAPD